MVTVKVRLETFAALALETTQAPVVPVVHDLVVPSLSENDTLTPLTRLSPAPCTLTVTLAVHLVLRAFQLVDRSRSPT